MERPVLQEGRPAATVLRQDMAKRATCRLKQHLPCLHTTPKQHAKEPNAHTHSATHAPARVDDLPIANIHEVVVARPHARVVRLAPAVLLLAQHLADVLDEKGAGFQVLACWGNSGVF